MSRQASFSVLVAVVGAAIVLYFVASSRTREVKQGVRDVRPREPDVGAQPMEGPGTREAVVPSDDQGAHDGTVTVAESDSVETHAVGLASSTASFESERAHWTKLLEKRLAAFREKPKDLDRAHDIAQASLMVWLSQKGRYEIVAEGERAALSSSNPHEHRISSSGPFGRRMFTFTKEEFPEYWELLAALRRPAIPGSFPHQPPVDETLAGEIEGFATLVLASLEQR